MISIKEFLAVCLFVCVLAADIKFEIAFQWYGLLLCLMSYLFSKEPMQAISKIIAAWSKSKK
tara:strand:+ start:2537 stop:2722 length:186 start_codon:yes stop_codon:yes gene_type:complete